MRLSFLLLALVGCDPDGVTFEPNTTAPIDNNDDDTGDFGSNLGMVCDAIDEDGTCSRYSGSAWDIGTAQQNCVAGTFYTLGFCPRATLGECTFAFNQPLERVASYYIGVWYDAAEEDAVASNCGLGEGSWATSTVGTGT